MNTLGKYVYLIILVLAALALAGFLFSRNHRSNEQFCRKFNENTCPQDKCILGPTCSICADMKCHSKDFYRK